MAVYLLDTNVWLFSQQDPGRLSAAQAAILTDHRNEFWLSVASVVEMTMLHRKGKLLLPGPLSFRQTLDALLAAANIHLLPVEARHTWRTANLPMQPDHNDPMDLLILAQAIEESWPVLSADRKFPWYVPHGLQLIA